MGPAIEPKNSVHMTERTQAMRKPHHGKVDFRVYMQKRTTSIDTPRMETYHLINELVSYFHRERVESWEKFPESRKCV
jgi:hypothetical protein